MSGTDNMAYDSNTLRKMQLSFHVPVLRFFRWDRPGATYGRHQDIQKYNR
jgi:lipoate-protein ligase A